MSIITRPAVQIPDSSLGEACAALATRPYAKRGVAFSDRRIRVLIADDHTLVRRALHLFLQRAASDIDIIGEASGGREAVEIATRLAPDVVVMDLDMADGDGKSATRTLHERMPDIAVLILSVHTEEEQLLSLLREGARGFLSKSAAEADLVDAIRVVASGDVYVRPDVARALAISHAHDGPDTFTQSNTRADMLSDRERTVLRLIAEGFTGPEIGSQLGITAKTVDTYKQRIEDKLGLSHRSAYVRFALDCGLLHG